MVSRDAIDDELRIHSGDAIVLNGLLLEQAWLYTIESDVKEQLLPNC